MTTPRRVFLIGALADLDLLKLQTAEHDITINTSSSDDVPSVEAILTGVRQRVQASQPTTFIHTGGAGVLEDGALGMYKSEKIHGHDEPADIEAIPLTPMHRKIDVTIVQAVHEFRDSENRHQPSSLHYGINAAHQRLSFVLTGLVRFALKHGFVGCVGDGSNM